MDFAGMDTEEEDGDEGDVTVTAERVGLGYGDVERQQVTASAGHADIGVGADERERKREEELGIGGSGSSKHASPEAVPTTALIEEELDDDEGGETLDAGDLRRLGARLDALSPVEETGQGATHEAVAIVSVNAPVASGITP